MIEHHSNQDGIFKTTIPSLSIIRRANVTERAYGVYNPSFCFIAQGMKQVFLAEERFEYGPSNYLVSSMNLPVIGQVIEASSDAPYLSLKLEFTQNEILEVLLDSKIHINPKENASRAMFVGQIDLSILDPVLRLAQLLNHPQDISFLAPFHKREIIYRLLQGHFGVALAQIAMEGSSTNRIRDAIDHITLHYDQPFRIEELAEIASMSISSFHRHFKEITAMSPLQFQKQLRLQEARRLLLTESADASEVAFRVGYESPSQFSREYSRMFGSPPKADIKRLKETYDQTQEITEHIIAGSNV
ncbi:AraC-like DNA-binding protein [Paenibacillus baekrokdamisoli]|uniref:AraC family transcriptional regulator n=1 Tax=Paenibacillus baekrokdamisoli TaxID=1712516 RepID=UPI00184D8F6C|nr:AraC family transcriptional regulator [Paenibacillus baekrokdamisoli]MBB3067288.1 AraC-like DNA-binding protein [Paenibacillus baekrokdamisoli]